MKKSDMKQCHRFPRDTELVPHTEFLRMKSLDTHASKQLEVVNGFTPVMVQCIHQTEGSLAYQMSVSFSKEHSYDLLKIRVTSR